MAKCKICETSGKPGWVKKSYPAPKDVVYGLVPYWPCPACGGTGIESYCEGTVGSPEEITNHGENR